MEFRIERIENIGDLEAIHRNLYCDASNLRCELEKESPNMLHVKTLAKSLHMYAHEAIDFEFVLEQRTIKEE